MIRVAIVDDHQLFRKSLVMLVNSFGDTQAVLDAENGVDFFEKLNILTQLPDIVLLDLEMPEMDGFETCERLRRDFPGIRILIVSQLTTRDSVHKTIEMGAHGFFTKNSDPLQLEQAIKGVQHSGYYFGMELGNVIREALLWQHLPAEPVQEEIEHERLSERELEVIKLAGRGFSSQEMADRLCVTIKTVESHRKRIIHKTAARNFVGAIIYACRAGYLDISELG